MADSVSGLIRYFAAVLLITLETVDTDTPASSAISVSVTARGFCLPYSLSIADALLGQTVQRGVGLEHGLRGELRRIGTSKMVRRVGTGPVEARAREDGDGPGRCNHWNARMVSEITYSVTGLLIH